MQPRSFGKRSKGHANAKTLGNHLPYQYRKDLGLYHPLSLQDEESTSIHLPRFEIMFALLSLDG